jgi:hypothetical protein
LAGDGTLRAIREPAGTSSRKSNNGEVAAASVPRNAEPSPHAQIGGVTTSHRASATELLETPGALLTRSHLRELGLERRAVDAVFRTLAVVFLPGYSRPMVRVEEFLELVERCTYRDDRVRPCVRTV